MSKYKQTMKIETLVKRNEISVTLGNILRNEGINTLDDFGNMSVRQLEHAIRNHVINRGGKLVLFRQEIPCILRFMK